MQTYQLSDTGVNVKHLRFQTIVFQRSLVFHVCALLMASLCCYLFLFKRLLVVVDYDQWGNGMTIFSV